MPQVTGLNGYLKAATDVVYGLLAWLGRQDSNLGHGIKIRCNAKRGRFGENFLGKSNLRLGPSPQSNHMAVPAHIGCRKIFLDLRVHTSRTRRLLTN